MSAATDAYNRLLDARRHWEHMPQYEKEEIERALNKRSDDARIRRRLEKVV